MVAIGFLLFVCSLVLTSKDKRGEFGDIAWYGMAIGLAMMVLGFARWLWLVMP